MNTGSALARFTITLSTAVTEPVQVEWHTSDGTAKATVDYAANKGIVVFAPGETAKTVDILVYGRAVGAEDRSFYVEMLPPTNAILGASIGECIITVDASGSTPVTQIIVPTGPVGPIGKSAYQSYLDTTTDNPPMTEPEWVESLKGDPAEIAQEVAPLIDVGETVLVAEGTEALSKPDSTTVKAIARRVAYAAPAKIATVVLADGDNSVGQSDMTGDVLELSSPGLSPRIMRGSTVISPAWSVTPEGKILIKGAIAGDVLYVCQYDFVSGKKLNTNTRELWRRSLAEVGLNLVDGSFEEGAVANSNTDAAWHIAGSQCYAWDGALPKSVPAGSTPESTGGVGMGAWVSVGDASLRTDLGKRDGFKLIGNCSSISNLRSIEPTNTQQRIFVLEHTLGSGIGGGYFYYDSTDSSTPDDDGITIVTAGGKRWKREYISVYADYYGIVTSDATPVHDKLNKALQAAKMATVKDLILSEGTYVINSALKVPSYVRLRGAGKLKTTIFASASMPITENCIQNELYEYKVFRTNYDTDIHIEDLGVDANNRARNTSETWMDATQGTTILLSTVRNSSIKRVYVQRGLQHGIDICAGYYFNDGNIDHNAVGGSYNILVEDVSARDTQLDDLITTHNSHDIVINRCSVWNNDPAMVWGNNQHGIEIDEGSYNVTVMDCSAENVITGFQQKGHDTTMPARSVKFIRCYAKDCVYSFQIEHRNSTTLPSGQHMQARNSVIEDCTSDNANNSKYTALHARAVYVLGFFGVYVRNLRVIGGSGNIYLTGGAKYINFDGIQWTGGYSGASNTSSEGLIHIETGTAVDDYCIRDFICEDTVTVPLIRDLTDTAVQREISNIRGYGGDATIPMIAIVPLSGDNVSNISNAGTWACALRDMARAIGQGDYARAVSFQNGFIFISGNGTPYGVVAGKPGAVYVNTASGFQYLCTAVGKNNWVPITTG